MRNHFFRSFVGKKASTNTTSSLYISSQINRLNTRQRKHASQTVFSLENLRRYLFFPGFTPHTHSHTPLSLSLSVYLQNSPTGTVHYENFRSRNVFRFEIIVFYKLPDGRKLFRCDPLCPFSLMFQAGEFAIVHFVISLKKFLVISTAKRMNTFEVFSIYRITNFCLKSNVNKICPDT